MDETLVRAYLVAHHNANPEAHKVFRQAVIRDFQRPEGRPLFMRIFRSMEHVDVRTPSGLYLAAAPTTRIESQRFGRIVEKIVRGLYYHEIDQRLDPEVPFGWVDVSEADIRDDLMRLPNAASFGDVVRYKFSWVDERPEFSLWYVQFYEGVTLQCHTGDPELLEQLVQEQQAG